MSSLRRAVCRFAEQHTVSSAATIRWTGQLVCLAVTLWTGRELRALSPEVPGAAQSQPIALVGATVHPVNGSPLAGATLLFEGGRIVALGINVALPPNTRSLDMTGKHVYPALFDALTTIGLVEIDAVRATRDFQETGDFNPNVRAQAAFNPDSEAIPVTRANGVLLALTAPRGGLVSGRAAVMQLDGWTWEDMTLSADAGLIFTWPNMAPRNAWWLEQRPREEQRRDDPLAALRRAFDDARRYQQARAAAPDRHPIDVRWDAMLPVLERRLPVIVLADELEQIQAAVAFVEQYGLRMILAGGFDAPECASLLKKHDIPVIVTGVYRLPRHRWEDYDAAYTLPERLRRVGLKFCISSSTDTQASNIRNLPYHAATAAAYGLPADEALRAITQYPAEILGVSERVGTLAVGKDATLIITTGDPLETTTQIEAAFLQGREVDLNNRHKRLWQKYNR